MALQYSAGVRTAQLAAINNALNVATDLYILTGAAPANTSLADTGVLLFQTSIYPAFNAPSAGSLTISGTWTDAALASGSMGYFRIKASGVTMIQGTVGTSGADMIVNSVSLTTGQTFTVLTFTLTAGNA